MEIYGKINIGLLVTGKRDNLHTIKTLFHSISLSDTFEFGGEGIELFDETGELDKEKYKENLSKIFSRFNILGAKVVKRIPLGGGLGGGTTPFVACCKYLNLNLSDEEKYKLSCDLPFMSKGGFALAEGVGEKLEFLKPKKCYALLVKSGSVDTAKAYALSDDSPRAKDNLSKIAQRFDTLDFDVPNDLYIPAVKLNGGVERVYSALSGYGLPCFMTGSGATIVVLSKDREMLERICFDSEKKLSENCFKKIVSFVENYKNVK